MTTACAIEIEWAGGTHTFDLGHRWVRNVLNYRGIPGINGDSIAACHARFSAAAYSAEDVARVLELGLIGGGLSRQEAANLIADHVHGKPLAPNVLVATAVLNTLFIGDANAA